MRGGWFIGCINGFLRANDGLCYILILILILMLKLELPQVMQPRSEAPNAGAQAFHFVPAHVGLLRLVLYPPILFPDARRAALR